MISSQRAVPEKNNSCHAGAGVSSDNGTEQHFCNISLRIYGLYELFQFVRMFGTVPVDNIDPVSVLVTGGCIFAGQLF